LHLSRKCWILELIDVNKSNQEDKASFTDLQLKKLRIYFAHLINCLGKGLSLRQRVAATANVYFKRFYLEHSFSYVDPALVAATCVYLASKVEESNTHVKSVCQRMKKIEREASRTFSYEPNDIKQCEFYLLESLQCYLIIFHPYRCLTKYLADAEMSDCVDITWNFVNDSYHTNVSLLYPPHIIALACIYLAGFYKRKDDTSKWFSNLNVEMKLIGEVCQELLELHQIWADDKFEKEVSELIDKLTKLRQQFLNIK